MPELQELQRKVAELENQLFNHDHNGNQYRPVYTQKLFGTIPAREDVVGFTPVALHLDTATIGTAAGNYDGYVLAPFSGSLTQVQFSAVEIGRASCRERV